MERNNSQLFKVGGVIGLVGVVLLLFGALGIAVLILTGVALIVIGAVILFIGMIRVIQLSREPVRHIYCPYCASKNDVFLSKTELPCDICGRKIGITPYGEAVPLEPMDDDED